MQCEALELTIASLMEASTSTAVLEQFAAVADQSKGRNKQLKKMGGTLLMHYS